PAVEPGDRTAGGVPGPRRRPVDGSRREGESEALRPDDRGPLRPGGTRRRIRRTGGAESGAADDGGESHGAEDADRKRRRGSGYCFPVRLVARYCTTV